MYKKDFNKDISPVRKNSRYEKFHKLFKLVPPDEYPVDYFSCAFIGDILLQGHLYVSQNFFCFYSKIRGRGRLLEIPMSRVISITREKTALIIPNAIGFQTAGKKYVFGTFLSRDSTYRFVVSAWKRSQELSKTLQQEDELNSEEEEDSPIIDQTPESQMDATDITQMFAHTDNNNQTNEIDSESDGGLCLECGAGDETNGKQNGKPNKLFAQNSTVVHEKPKIVKPRFFIGGGKLGIPYFFQCFDCEKMYEAFSQLSLKLQRIPRTNLILAICIFMTLFLIASAMALTYKILVIQATIDAKNIWSPSSKAEWREKMYSSIYSLQSQSHISIVRQINDILKSNIVVLHELSKDLERLKMWETEITCCEKEAGGEHSNLND